MTVLAARRRRSENPLVEGLERLPVRPTTLVVFGATGDLAQRKLLPALYNLAHDGALPERIEVVGVARGDQSQTGFCELVRQSIYRFSRRRPDPYVLDELLHSEVDPEHDARVHRPERRAGKGPSLDDAVRGLSTTSLECHR